MLTFATASKKNMCATMATSFLFAFAMGTATRGTILENSAQHCSITADRNTNNHNTRNNTVVLPTFVSADGTIRGDVAYDTYSAPYGDASSSDAYEYRTSPRPGVDRADEAYYESVVHPAMLLAKDSDRVAVVGGGGMGGAAAVLREVLKHRLVLAVTVFDANATMESRAGATKDPRNYCGDIQGSAPSCFDDPRVTVVTDADAVSWFTANRAAILERRKNEDEEEEDENDDEEDDDEDDDEEGDDEDGLEERSTFGVIFANLVDPKDTTTSANDMYTNPLYKEALSDALGRDGTLVIAQNGQTASSFSSKDEFSVGKLVRDLVKDDNGNGWFESIHVFDEMHPETGSKWATMIACKNIDCRESWHNDAALFEYFLHEMILPSTSSPSRSLLKHFDGATMMQYQVPHKAFETSYCEDFPHTSMCVSHRGIPHDLINIHTKDLDIRTSTIGEGAGLGLFTKVDIQPGSAIAIEQSLDPAFFRPYTVVILENEQFLKNHPVLEYANFYGYDGDSTSNEVIFVESGLSSFVNHGCKGSYNLITYLDSDDNTESNAMYTVMHEFSPEVDSVYGSIVEESGGHGYNPVLDRHLVAEDNKNEVAKREIKAGEELFSNYLPYANTIFDWEYNLNYLRTICGSS